MGHISAHPWPVEGRVAGLHPSPSRLFVFSLFSIGQDRIDPLLAIHTLERKGIDKHSSLPQISFRYPTAPTLIQVYIRHNLTNILIYIYIYI